MTMYKAANGCTLQNNVYKKKMSNNVEALLKGFHPFIDEISLGAWRRPLLSGRGIHIQLSDVLLNRACTT